MTNSIKPHSRILMLSLSLWLIGTSAAWADMVDAKSLLAQADAAYAKREDVSQATIAMDFYEKLGAAGADSATEAYWKAARAAWWVAEHTPGRTEKLEVFQRGIDDAKKGIALNSGMPAAHFWLGANMGSYGDNKGVMKSLSLVKPIRHEMQEVLHLDEKFAAGGAWRVLGVVDYKVPGLMGGSKKRAKEELDKALAIGPNDPFNHFYMAEYDKTIGDKAGKEAEVATLRAIKEAKDLEPELKMLQEKAGKL